MYKGTKSLLLTLILFHNFLLFGLNLHKVPLWPDLIALYFGNISPIFEQIAYFRTFKLATRTSITSSIIRNLILGVGSLLLWPIHCFRPREILLTLDVDGLVLTIDRWIDSDTGASILEIIFQPLNEPIGLRNEDIKCEAILCPVRIDKFWRHELLIWWNCS